MTALDERIAKYPQKILAVDNVDISYREAGQGIPVVLLHGIGSGSGSWLFQLESLQQNYHLIAWDAPGYGQSSPLTKEIPEALDYADTLKRLVDALRLKTFYLIGHSFGALIAAAYCHQFSASVSSLVLVDPAMGYGKNRPEERDRKNHARIELMQSLGPGGLAQKRGRKLVSSTASKTAIRLVRWNMSRLHKKGYIQAVNMLANSDLCEFCKGIDKSVLVLCGSDDQITPETMAIKIAWCYERSHYISLEGMGHASYIEGAEIFNQYLDKFIAARENNTSISEAVVSWI